MNHVLILPILFFMFVGSNFGQAEKESDKTQKGSGKMTAEEVIRKHLASIGTSEALAEVKSRVMVGTGRLTSKIGYNGQLSGPSQFASEGDKIVLAMIFNSNDYPYEKVGFDGENITIGRPTVAKSRLGEFLKSQSSVIKQGLFGGVLSSAWPLLNVNAKKAKMEYGGITKRDGQEFHKLKYIPARGGSLKVVLYFDAETFRHMMSEYQYIVPIQMGANMTENSQAKPGYFTLIEQFSDFKTAGQLTLPFSYTINVSAQNRDETVELEWRMKIAQVYFNEPLESTAFKVS